MLVSISKIAKELGVHPQTLRRLAKEGQITEHRSLNGHRRFDLEEVKSEFFGMKVHDEPDEKITVLYSRVSSSGQKQDLCFQNERLKLFSASKGWKSEEIQDIGSGLNYKRQGFMKMIDMAESGGIGKS